VVKEKELNVIQVLARNQHAHIKDEAERKFEQALLGLKHKQALLIAKQEGDEDLKTIAKASMLTDKERDLSIEELDARIKQIRMAIEAKAKKLAFLGIRRQKDFEWDLERQKRVLDAQLKSKELKDKTDAQVRVWVKKSEIYLKQKQAQLLEMEKRKQIEQQHQKHVENLVDKAGAAGVLTEGAITETVRHATIRKALDQSDSVAQSFAKAEGKKHTKEVFQQGLREQPSIGFSGKGKVIVTKQVSLSNGLLSHDDGLKKMNCPNCNRAIPVDAKICGYCEYAIGKLLDR
jgi:hypothetical protein